MTHTNRAGAFDVIMFPESEPESTVAGRRREVWEALFRTGVPRDLFSGRYASVQKPAVLDVQVKPAVFRTPRGLASLSRTPGWI
jgi:hypothetical protein